MLVQSSCGHRQASSRKETINTVYLGRVNDLTNSFTHLVRGVDAKLATDRSSVQSPYPLTCIFKNFGRRDNLERNAHCLTLRLRERPSNDLKIIETFKNLGLQSQCKGIYQRKKFTQGLSFNVGNLSFKTSTREVNHIHLELYDTNEESIQTSKHQNAKPLQQQMNHAARVELT